MDILEALYTTRAMRRMERMHVSDDLVQRLVDAAIRAPSGGNLQNWRFVVIRARETKELFGSLFRAELAEARRTFYSDLEKALARGERGERLDAHARMMRSVQHLADNFEEIPLFVAALLRAQPLTFSAGGSIYPAVWSLQLAARGHGIGSVPVGSLSRRELEILPWLGVPPHQGWRLATCVALGYPKGNWGVASRRPANEVTFLERWGEQPTWQPHSLWPT